MTRSGWMKIRIGDAVVHGDELKHVGIVEKITSGIALVRWTDTGWRSEVFCLELKKVRRSDDQN